MQNLYTILYSSTIKILHLIYFITLIFKVEYLLIFKYRFFNLFDEFKIPIFKVSIILYFNKLHYFF